jgi:hypothetical protein
MLRVLTIFAMAGSLVACNVEPPQDPSTDDPISPDTTQPSKPLPIMFLAGTWQTPCTLHTVVTENTGSTDLYYREVLDIGVDSYVGRQVIEEDARFPIVQVEYLDYTDADCTQYADYDTYGSITWPEWSYDSLTELELIVEAGFKSYLIGNPVQTPSGEYAMEVDFLTFGFAFFDTWEEIGNNFIFKDIFSIKDGGNTLVFGSNSKQIFNECMVANQDDIARTSYVDDYTFEMHTYEGLTLTNLSDYNTTAYSFDHLQNHSLQNTDPTHEYGYDPNYEMNMLIGVTKFSSAVALSTPCERPTELDHQKVFTRKYWPAWW